MLGSRIHRGVAVLQSIAFAALLAAGCGELPPGEAGVKAAPAAEPQQGAGVQRAPRGTATLLSQADFCDDALSPACTPTGAHGALAVNFATGHAGYDCKECHYIGGRLAFKPASAGGLAFVPAPGPRPFFDATAKTCSNIACHAVPAGTYSYSFPGGDGEPVVNTVSYGGTPQLTPSWYATGGAGCTACHGNPPANYTWHGYHTSGGNQCELCHGDAVSVGGIAVGLSGAWCNPTTGFLLAPATSPRPAGAVVCSTLHANGTVNVQGRFRSTCFNCH